MLDLIFDDMALEETEEQNKSAVGRNIFAAAAEVDENQTSSGMFGVARRSVEKKEEGKGVSSGLFKKAGQRVGLADGVIRFLKVYTEKTPVLLVIDDLELENAQALGLLKQMLEAITEAQLVILVTYEPTLNPELDAQTLVVPDLNEEETYQVALAILHTSELDPKLKSLIWGRSAGVLSLLRRSCVSCSRKATSSRVEGYAELKQGADVETLPDDVREMVISRLDSFSPLTQTVLRAAAVLADDFSPEALQAVSEIENLSDLRSILDDLCKAQVLETVEGDSYRFRNGLTQGVIYESLSRAQRLKLHRMAVRYWRDHREFTYQPIVLAYHLIKCGLLPEAIEVVTSAAADAEQNGDIERAVELYTHAQGIFPDERSIKLELERLAQAQKDEQRNSS